MSSNFSGALKLANLNDFIAPSQACVVTLSKNEKPVQKGLVQLQRKPAARFDQTLKDTDEPVRVTLHDCLACSGCITSAETVMLEQQSTTEFLNRLKSGDSAVIVSLSPQSRASLASHYNLTALQAFKKLTTYFKSLGVKAVFDTSCSRDLSLIEACEEFVSLYRESHGLQKDTSSKKPRSLPVLASACPGWVCYAEKTHGSKILPFISTVKSPQQVMGAIIKRHAWKMLGIRPDNIYHVTVMPCYDKKLEASRDDFLFAVDGAQSESQLQIAEVDAVLTSGEVLDMLESQQVEFMSLEEAPLDKLLTNLDEGDHLYGVLGGSGGYVDTIFRYAARTLFGKEITGQLDYRTLRNTDFREVTLEHDGKVVLRFALAYGFRNIQTVVRKIKTGKFEYDFVEVMACPAGCLNGGGQIKPKKEQSAKELIQNLESVYLKEVDVKDPFNNPVVKGLYDEWLQHPRSARALDIMHTTYHNREMSLGSKLNDW
ncbi:cytosolic iron-sulfur assembly component 3 [Marchantia polymorpha subsp. ruderalis]|nr:hypothetical protein MARPO_0020s0065 [Marchantia polymorpha]BBN09827.1 hypothetical protein Mp_4g23030 [Marchantia polymorpha subsp. ruderalis]PTQ44403.1 hypothetical protein MARPO_0020s0065 [Marchantia polymorpha]PTQ44404.1 hypothetical protein MARPO_0020s0065 [Marchantia polymorpha]PTQ44405.1 hypothetical protein MARPO_0020s0065 [Marchantia polymorpha]|eukprot:PTQ44402.1 hypothetical protein MARPO_0020s0065 [Marchantia polymorpha]